MIVLLFHVGVHVADVVDFHTKMLSINRTKGSGMISIHVNQHKCVLWSVVLPRPLRVKIINVPCKAEIKFSGKRVFGRPRIGPIVRVE